MGVHSVEIVVCVYRKSNAMETLCAPDRMVTMRRTFVPSFNTEVDQSWIAYQ